MRSLFIIATCIAGALVLLFGVFPWAVVTLFQIMAGVMVIALIAYAGAEAYPHIHAYLKRRGIAE